MYQPAMLVVGTRGRSLGGLHGLVNTRNSFSKYCLQYSPVPVVVVRPTEKRNKKKERRAADSTRKTYARMLAATNGKHEADSDTASTYDLEVQISADEEAHQVAKVLGLPASFDPTIKPLAQATATKRLSATSSPQVSTTNLVPPTSTPAAAEAAASTDASSAAPGDTDKVSGDDDKRQVAEGTATTVVVDEAKMPEIGSGNSESSDGDDDDEDDGGDEGEFEVMSGQEALDQQKLEQLHKMEVGEAAALRMKVDSDDDEDDEDKS